MEMENQYGVSAADLTPGMLETLRTLGTGEPLQGGPASLRGATARQITGPSFKYGCPCRACVMDGLYDPRALCPARKSCMAIFRPDRRSVVFTKAKEGGRP